MESISRLRAVLIDSLDNRRSQQDEQELFDQLMVHKHDLLNVFNVGQRNDQERRELESGR
jgi:nuclear pore complex protein Nup205